LKKGCLGCTGVLVLGAALVVSVMAVAWMQTRHEEAATSESTRELNPSIDSEPVVVELDIAWANVIVKTAADGEPIGVSATYDQSRHVLDVSTQEELGAHDVLKVRFVPSGSRTLAALRPMVGGNLPRLEVQLPSDTPVAIRARISGGVGLFDLGQLWLTQVKLDIDWAVTQVQFREPTVHPVESMELVCRGGNMVLYNLGHASPGRLVIHQGMGPGFFDLGGEWRTDAEVQVTVAFGSGDLRVPDNVAVVGLEDQFARYNHRPSAAGSELGPPTLDMRVHFDVGDIRISRESPR